MKKTLFFTILFLISFTFSVLATASGFENSNINALNNNVKVDQSTNLLECGILNGGFSLGSDYWSDISEGPGLGSGIINIISHERNPTVLNMDSRAGSNYYLFWAQNISSCDISNKVLKWSWKLPQIEGQYGLGGVYIEFYGDSMNLLGRYVVRKHTGNFNQYLCSNYLAEQISDHPYLASGCEEDIGTSFEYWESKRIWFNEEFFNGLYGAQLNPEDVKYMKIILMSYNNAGAGVNVYFDNFVYEEDTIGHDYVYYDGDFSWEEANDYCNNFGVGWHMITINDIEENNWMWSSYGNYPNGDDIWIGLKDVNGNGNYEDDEWTYSTSSFRAWQGGQGSTSSQCVWRDQGDNGNWHDESCTSRADVVCEGNVPIITRNTDLTLSTSDIFFSNDSPMKGDIVTITSLFHNLLEDDPDSVRVRFYAGEPSDYTFIGEDIADINMVEMNEYMVYSSSFVAQIEWTLPIDSSFVAGDYDVHVVIDPLNEITEENEDNNVASKTINIRTKPDIRIRDNDIFFTNNYPNVGEEIFIIAMVRNIENEPSGEFIIKFFDETINRVIGEISLTLDGLETKVAMVPWYTKVQGTHIIHVIVDSEFEVNEWDESNNEAQRSIFMKGKPRKERSNNVKI